MIHEVVLVSRIADVPALTHPCYVKSVAFSPDGRMLASGDERRRVSFWDSATGAKLHSIEKLGDRPFTEITSLAFAPDGRSLAAGVDNAVTILDPEGKAAPESRTKHTRTIKQVAFLRDAIISIGEDGDIRRTALGKGRDRLLARNKKSESLAVLPDGSFAVGRSDGKISLYQEDGKEARVLENHDGPVKALAVSRSGQLASVAYDGIRIWEGATSRLIAGQWIFGINFTPDGGLLALMGSSSGLETIRTFAPDGRELRSLDVRQAIPSDGPGTAPEFCIAFSPDAALVALAGHDRWIALIQTSSGTRLPSNLPKRPCEALAFSPDGASIAAADDKDVRICTAQSGVESRRFTLPQTVYDLAFAPDGKRLIVRHVWGTAVLDAQTGKHLAALKDPSDIGSAVVSPDGELVAAAGWGTPPLRLFTIDGAVRRDWTAPHGTHEQSIPVSDSTYESPNGAIFVAFSANGRWLASVGGWHGEEDVRVWDLHDEGDQPIAILEKVKAAWFLPDDSLIVSHHSESRVVAIGDGEPRVLRTLPFMVKAVSPSGRAAGFAEVVDLTSGQTIATVPKRAHRGGIVAMAVSADGRLLATSGENGAVIVWRIP